MSFIKYQPETLTFDYESDQGTIGVVRVDEAGTQETLTFDGDQVDMLIVGLENQRDFGVAFEGGEMLKVIGPGVLTDPNTIITKADGRPVEFELPYNSENPVPTKVMLRLIGGVGPDNIGQMLSGLIASPLVDHTPSPSM